MKEDIQHTLTWFRSRIGNFTGSKVGVLMKSGRASVFSDTAMTYIYQVAAERCMSQDVVEDDELFELYLKQVDVTNKAMRWGTEQEKYARECYERLTKSEVEEVGSIPHPSIPHFASSPDGIRQDKIGKVTIEIKCPVQSTYMKYKNEIRSAKDLKRVNPEYFYQCHAHMICAKSVATDFIVYNPFQKDPIHVVRIPFDTDTALEIEKRVKLANETVDTIIL